jgi:large subunit ribosomal protein L14
VVVHSPCAAGPRKKKKKEGNLKMYRLSRLLHAPAAPAAPVEGGVVAAPAASRSWFRHDLWNKRRGNHTSYWGTGMEGPQSFVPLQKMAKLQCVDNSNAKHIRLLGHTAPLRASTKIAPCVVHRVALMRYRSGFAALNRQKIQPGSLYWCVLFSTRQYTTRYSGLVTSFDKNAAVLINDKKVPVGSRVMYVAARHVNHRCHLKAAVLANFFM